MREMQCIVVLLFIGAITPSSTFGAKEYFVCQIKNEIYLKDDGTVDVRRDRDKSLMVGTRFIVDRDTGNVRGDTVSNTNADKITILDRAKHKGNSFHLYWTHATLVSVPFTYLHIEAFKQPQSPFVLITSSTVISGLCD